MMKTVISKIIAEKNEVQNEQSWEVKKPIKKESRSRGLEGK